MKFHMEVHLGELYDINSVSVNFWEIWNFVVFLCISIWIGFGINGMNKVIQNSLHGLFSNLEHILLVLVYKVG